MIRQTLLLIFPLLAFVSFRAIYGCENGLYLDQNWTKTDLRSIAKLKFKDIYLKNSNPNLQEVREILMPARIQAWLGIRVCHSSTLSKRCFQLSSKEARKSLLSQVSSLWKKGFDGVHLDLELIQSGDPEFISLLKEIRTQKPTGKHLSIASAFLELDAAPKDRSPYTWKEDYFKAIAPYIDQIMVMNYDTTIRTPEDYARFTTRQTQFFTKFSQDNHIELQIGIPIYQQGRKGLFHPKAENLLSATKGIKEVWSKETHCPKQTGVGIFVWREFSVQDQETFTSEWTSRK